MATETPAPSITPWVEKYRPQSIDDIVQQNEVVNTLRSSILNGELPHLIFHGPPGTGKTSTALALCHTLFTPQEFSSRVKELNASDERGIDAVRNKIKQFASLTVPTGKVPFKIVILDEADSMTKDAQNALRRIIENYSTVTRFIIVCNYVSKIIDPILSRCAKFRFKSLDQSSIIGRLMMIASKENIAVSDDSVYETLVEISHGDLRKAITFMQSASITGSMTSFLLREISGTPDDSIINEYFEKCLNDPWMQIEKATERVVMSGFDVSQILESLIHKVIKSYRIPEAKKASIIEMIAAADGNITNRADPLLQFLNISSHIMAVRTAAI